MNTPSSSAEPFQVRMSVRSYELDPQGHVNGAVHVQYSSHALYACVRAAGVDVDQLIESGVAPVITETAIRYHHELRGGDEVDVSCAFHWREGKVYRVESRIVRADGLLVTEVRHVAGLLDLRTRLLVDSPATHWRRHATDLRILGLAEQDDAG